MIGLVEHIHHERDFKFLCDGLLRFEVGPLVQTYGTYGADKGIDAEFDGKYGGIQGRWVFQYKFLSPAEAPTRQRARLKALYCSEKAPSEFSGDGVHGADVYVLLTNVPATVSFVHALRERWSELSRRRTRLVVWDPSRLNALLKGREYLARTWTGVREASCRQHVVAPLWDWVQHAGARLAESASFPMWPLVLESVQHNVHTARFAHSYEGTHVVEMKVDAWALEHAEAHPLFPFARDVAYPRALSPLEALRARLGDLRTVLIACVEEMKTRLRDRSAGAREMGDERGIASGVALALLEKTWGFPSTYHGMRQGKFLVGGKAEFECPAGLEADLDALVAETPHGRIPAEVLQARRSLSEAVEFAWRSLWHVVELGIDAE